MRLAMAQRLITLGTIEPSMPFIPKKAYVLELYLMKYTTKNIAIGRRKPIAMPNINESNDFFLVIVMLFYFKIK